MTDRTYLDVHVIQPVPPANLNRDDAGSPKTAVYGGARRARVSSQAWKRATRTFFAGGVPEEQRATRTKRIAQVLTTSLTERTTVGQEAAARISTTLLRPLGIKANKRKDTETSYLLFFGRGQIARLVDVVAPHIEELAALDDAALDRRLTELVKVEEELRRAHPAEVALFGRMVADLPHLNVEAAVQVAHALSTHAVEAEFDYFTAVDDEKDRTQGDDAGAGMIGTVEFNSAVLYRYTTLGLHLLADNLGGSEEDVVTTTRRFVEGFVRSMPTGHQNAFAHRTLPSAAVVIVRDDQPVNLVSAFEEPIRSRSGHVGASVAALATEQQRVLQRWGGNPLLVAATYDTHGDASQLTAAFGPSLSFDALLTQVEELARRRAPSVSS